MEQIERHKKLLIDLDGHHTVLQFANSNRAAFVIELLKPPGDVQEDNDEEIAIKQSHTYCAMQLEHQHALQHTVLSRIDNADLVGCFLKAIQDTLGISLRNSAIHAEWIRQEDDRSEALQALYTGLAATVPRTTALYGAADALQRSQSQETQAPLALRVAAPVRILVTTVT